MIQTKNGRYVRQNTPCVEMDVSKDTSYHTFCLLAADKLKLEGVRSKELEPCLFKMNGSMVLDDDITLKGCNKPWTIGRYLLLLKKSAQNVKFGIGIVEMQVSTDDNDNNSHEEVCNYSLSV